MLIWGLLFIGTPVAVFRLLITRGRKYPVPVPSQDVAALEAVLGARRCDRCKRDCELIAPKCRRGRVLRDEIIKEQA
jgi:hypothetical protein